MPKRFNIGNTFLAIALGLCVIVILGAYNNKLATVNVSGFGADTTQWPTSFGFGKPATQQQIMAWDIDVRSDGLGLPPGSGTVVQGRVIYNTKCMACHGSLEKALPPDAKLPAPVLVSDSTSKVKAIGNYWPYASTVFDYIRRAMPYNLPGSLTDNEVYSVTAYLLNANKIIKADAMLDAKSLPQIVMPAQQLFINDDRHGGPEVR
ncbi:c-type cytochrome [Mucilaginibacter sp. SG564]|uniref:c-type cytochrome n=1 Tax=unclassified Mucilaginibacter TaxID=2617802 RepID=UPI0015563769|nr:c-type cytochrome [Mucilaginibacter sp. SG564]NOW93649.1 cytochrome c [Mucilaginibacter sp. SG564]